MMISQSCLIMRILLFTEAQVDYPKELCSSVIGFLDQNQASLSAITKEILIEALSHESE
jgi:hypothetical protein